MDVTVSIAHWGTPGTLRRAVDSVLGQTFEDFTLIVANDGDSESDWYGQISDITDSRVLIIDRDDNVGRYAIDHQIVASAQTRWWSPLDADDYAEPDWLERMVDQGTKSGCDVVFTDQMIHRREGDPGRREPCRRWDGTDRFQWLAHLSGLWSVPWLRHTGLTNPNARIGWDQIMTSAAFLHGDVINIHTPLVHRVGRPDSLTRAKRTGFGSPARKQVQAEYAALWRKMVREAGL